VMVRVQVATGADALVVLAGASVLGVSTSVFFADGASAATTFSEVARLLAVASFGIDGVCA